MSSDGKVSGAIYDMWNAPRTEQDAVGRWTFIIDIIYNAAITTFGKREGQNPDWFNANLQELEPVLKTTRPALLDNLQEVPM